MEADDALALLTSDPARTGIFTDFDGTLSEIVDRPEDATAVTGAQDALTELTHLFGLVAVVSGRSLEDLRGRLRPPGVVLAGSYGRERSDRSTRRRPTEGWETVSVATAAAIASLPGVVLERKGAGVALHYRGAPHLETAVQEIAERTAAEFGLELMKGRLVAELVRPGPGKDDAIGALCEEHSLTTVFIAGDDVADLAAFRWARASGLRSVLVAVMSDESPPGLEAEADIVVPGPAQIVALLRRLAAVTP
jgi:trehalose 6-phosphate phosphatase